MGFGEETDCPSRRQLDMAWRADREAIIEHVQHAPYVAPAGRKKLTHFNLSGHVSKLRYLPRAAEMHGDAEAIQRFKTDTAWLMYPRKRQKILAREMGMGGDKLREFYEALKATNGPNG